MGSVKFCKMSGAGNDFIFINNTNNEYDLSFLKDIVYKLCARRLSIGADGLVILNNSNDADFSWLFYNADGTAAEMCGNAARCAARFAYINNIAGKKMSFKTLAGIINAEILDKDAVKVEMTEPSNIELDIDIPLENGDLKGSFINTGVPHVVIKTDKIEDIDLISVGKLIRYHKIFAPAGTNVDFYSQVDRHTIKMRTYERGVEGETLACGTGALSVAIIAKEKGFVSYPVKIATGSSKVITVSEYSGKYFIEGEARIIYNGCFGTEAYNY
jgi:diaminopimelate epimerase